MKYMLYLYYTTAALGCIPNPCRNGGICSSVGSTGYKCGCAGTGFTGVDCSEGKLGLVWILIFNTDTAGNRKTGNFSILYIKNVLMTS